MDKKELRHKARQILAALTQENLMSSSRLISKNLKTLSQDLYSKKFIQNGLIGAYAPIQQEAIWFSEFDEKTNKYALPHIANETEMEYFELELESIKTNNIGLKLENKYLGQGIIPDVLFIPGLAFTKKGARLGRGKGYFDRFLSSYSGIKIGVAFEDQIFEDLPVDEHDELMNYLVTEKKIYKI